METYKILHVETFWGGSLYSLTLARPRGAFAPKKLKNATHKQMTLPSTCKQYQNGFKYLVLVRTRIARFEPTRGRQMDITLKKQIKAKQTNSFIHWLTTFFLDWIYKCSSFFFASRMLGRSAEITDLWHNWKKEKPCSWQWSQRKKEDKTESPSKLLRDLSV